MKKLFFTLLLAVAVCVSAEAQPRAVGIRGSYGAEVSYQHTLQNNFIEANLGWFSGAFDLHAAYNFVIASPEWTKGEWNFYAGPGCGFWMNTGLFAFGIGGMVGLDYTFDGLPLQLSVDIRPDIFSVGAAGSQTVVGWFAGWYPSLGVRYRF